MGFTKLDEGILRSSIMAESPITFKIWIAILASCGPDGVARISSVFLSSACHLSQANADRAIEVLSKPDPRSRSEVEGGRRIRRVDGGYFVINYEKYRTFTYSDNPESIRKREYRKRVHGRDIFGTCPGHSASASASASVLETKKELKIKVEDQKLVQLLIDLMTQNNPESSIIKRLTEKRQFDWITACRLMREQDERTVEQIEAVIRFSQADSFWKSNILSMPKLREKWDQLWMKMRRTTGADNLDGIKAWLREIEAKNESTK